MIKNVSRSIMLSATLAILVASCSQFRTVNYHPPSYKGESTSDNYKRSKKGESREEVRLRKNITQYAQKYVGVKYKSAGKNPKGFDCSGFTGYVFKKHDIALSANSGNQARQGKKIPLRQAKTGDLLFFGNRGRVNHVALIVSNGKEGIEVIHSTSSKGVMVQNVSKSSYWKPKILFARDVIEP